MKSSLLIIAFLVYFPISSAELEFEEVYQIHPENGLSNSPEIYLKGDTVLLLTSVYDSNDTDSKWREVISESCDEGKTWNDLTSFIGEGTGISKFYQKGYHQMGRYFVKPMSVDTTLKYFDLKGNITKEVYYFRTLSNLNRIYFNLQDENYIGLQFLYKHAHLEYLSNSNFIYSTNKGNTWTYISPIEEMEKQGLDPYEGGSVHQIINPSIINPEKYYFFISTEMIVGMIQGFIYDYRTKEYVLLGTDYYNSCFECFGENNMSLQEDIYGNSSSIDVITKEITNHGNFYTEHLGINLDSARNSDPNYNDDFYERIERKFHISNAINPYHQIVGYTHYQYDNTNDNREYPFVHQYFYQTFDNGKKWELVYFNKDKNNLVYKIYINPLDNNLWMIKGIQNIPSEDSKSTKHTIYKSKSPLTNVELNDRENNDFKISISNRLLHITSPNNYTDAVISLYNLNGKLISKLNTSIVKGKNSLDLINSLRDNLILVKLRVDGETIVLKIIKQ